MPSLVVHHLDNSRSQRVLWLLEELDLSYDIRTYQRDPATLRAPASLRTVHPLGKAPVLTDGDVTIAESGAIVEYLVSRYGNGRLVPVEGTPERLRYTYWLHYAEGSLMPLLLLSLVFGRLPKSPMPFFVKPVARAISARALGTLVTPQLATHLDFMEAELGRTEWFAGNQLTAADIQMSFAVEALRARGGLDERRPKLLAYLDRIHARPAYQRALERGGPFEALR